MLRSDKETVSAWMGTARHPATPFPSLQADTVCDICVIGAGLAGLTTAYLLSKAGRNVVVIDAWDFVAGETSRTTAHLTAILDDRYFEYIDAFGLDKAQLLAESHMAAINRIEAIVMEERIDCDFERCDGYLAAVAPDQAEDLKKEAEAALNAGFADRLMFSAMPLRDVSMQAPVMMLPQQATFNPLKYAVGLADAITRRGGRIFGATRAVDVKNGPVVEITTENGHHISASAAVVATHTPVNDKITIHTKQAPYRTYVIACELFKASMPQFLLWDMDEPYHYVRVMRGEDRDYLIVGGEDHKTGQENDAEDRYAALEAWTRRHFPLARGVTHKWSGQVLEPVDRVAFIGRNPGEKNVYIATGFSGNGMTYSTISGILISDLIEGRDNPWAGVFDPARKPYSSASAGEYLRENTNVAGRYVRDWMSGGEVGSEEDLARGEGAVIRRGLSKVAAYRDEEGTMHVCSAVCTHMDCIVQWNAAEKSWDCPCHGSRFSIEGDVLHGPAVKPLEQKPVEGGLEAPVATAQPRYGGPFPMGPQVTPDGNA